MGSIYFNGSELTGQHDVNFNGTAMDNVYLNSSKIWTRHPYAPGTHLITQATSMNDTFSSWITTHWGTYGTVMFKQQPYGISGSPGSDYRITINLQPGFYFSYFSRADCTDSDGQGTSTGSGQSTTLYSGNTVSGATGFTCAEGGGASSSSGNGTSTIKVGYSGT
jgi:hypothetical protein